MTSRHASSAEDRLSIGEAARIAGVAVETLRRWANEGRIAVERTPGGQRRFRLADVRALSESNATGPAGKPKPVRTRQGAA